MKFIADLLDIILELFRTPESEVYATVSVNGHQENLAVCSKDFRFLLEQHFYQANGKLPSERKIKEILSDLKCQARFGPRKIPV